jgi:hypothetical protein
MVDLVQRKSDECSGIAAGVRSSAFRRKFVPSNRKNKLTQVRKGRTTNLRLFQSKLIAAEALLALSRKPADRIFRQIDRRLVEAVLLTFRF